MQQCDSNDGSERTMGKWRRGWSIVEIVTRMVMMMQSMCSVCWIVVFFLVYNSVILTYELDGDVGMVMG